MCRMACIRSHSSHFTMTNLEQASAAYRKKKFSFRGFERKKHRSSSRAFALSLTEVLKFMEFYLKKTKV